MELSKDWQKRLANCQTSDQFFLRKTKQKYLTAKPEKKAELAKLLQETIERSEFKNSERKKRLPIINFPDLPVANRAAEIIQLIKNNQVVVVAGETGSGKTTQLPKMALAAGCGVRGYIGHTQPRKIAARTVATRIAEELNSPLGDIVGYKVRFTDQFSADGFVKVMTDGLLLAELSADPYLSQYDTLIIDEAHERSLNIDFLLGYIKNLLSKRKDLKVIITSATIDVERFSDFFNKAPIISVEGRTYPVDVWYRPIESNKVDAAEKESSDQQEKIPQAILRAVDECIAYERQHSPNRRGDILVFSSNEREIRDIAQALRKYGPDNIDILPLYARLSINEQKKVFQSSAKRRIVIATNVAETALTVPNIYYVIDPGYARISRYSYRSKVQRLPIEAISQASANQRKGRCGRIGPGLCLRLYDEQDFLARDEFSEPEIRRTNLASVILTMKNLGLGDVDEFSFLEAPDERYIKDGYQLLEEIFALDSQKKLLPLGKKIAQFPIDPRLAKMVLSASQNACLREILIIVSALSIQDIRERPAEKAQLADERHATFKDPDSDFIWYINLWQAIEKEWPDLSEAGRRDFAKRYFLSYLRLREWREIHRQLLTIAHDLSLKMNAEPANYSQIHQALLTGYLARVAQKTEEREYLATRNQKAHVFPNSVLFKKMPAWVMAAEIVETSKVYLRCLAKIEPEWVERAGQHLLKKHYYDPHWEKKRGRVIAYEQSSLFGLIVNPKKVVNYDQIDPVKSRIIFIQSALVQADIESKAPFFKHNQKLIADIKVLEEKQRRPDILVPEQVLLDFYDKRIPEHIHNWTAFEAWRKQAEPENPTLLYLTEADITQQSASQVTEDAYPNHLICQDTRFDLRYSFNPSSEDDGVTILAPISHLDCLDEDRLTWLVPGFIEQKIEFLLKSLPKAVRRSLIPIPNTVQNILNVIHFGQGNLYSTLIKWLASKQISVSLNDFLEADIPRHLRMNIAVLNSKGKIIQQSRDLSMIKKALRQEQSTVASNVSVWPTQALQTWPDAVSFSVYVDEEKQRRWYPALHVVQEKNHELVFVKGFASVEEANYHHKYGVNALLRLHFTKEIKALQKQILNDKSLVLNFAPYGDQAQLLEVVSIGIARAVFLEAGLMPKSSAEFALCAKVGAPKWFAQSESLLKTISQNFSLLADVKRALSQVSPLFSASVQDIQQQLNGLQLGSFLRHESYSYWQHYPRYLRALILRLERLPNNLLKDQSATTELQRLERAFADFLAQANGLTQSPASNEFRWLLQEYRVSLFAQTLKTAVPVSAKRLDAAWIALTTQK